MRIRKEEDISNDTELQLIARCSDAFAHPARIEIFRHIYSENLARRTVCNKDLVAVFDYSQATISGHLRKLVFSGLIDVEEQGSRNYYFVNIGVLNRYMAAMRKLHLPSGPK